MQLLQSYILQVLDKEIEVSELSWGRYSLDSALALVAESFEPLLQVEEAEGRGQLEQIRDFSFSNISA